MKEVYCRRCGQFLSSPRARKKGIGQRCWREERGLPPLPYQRKSVIDSVPFVVSGTKNYVQLKLGDWD